MFYNCFDCDKVTPPIGAADEKFPSCGAANGEVIAKERFEVFYSIAPKTGNAPNPSSAE